MPRMRWRLWSVGVALAGPWALAGDVPDSPEKAADLVIEALASKNGAALSALAGAADPDPWLVAEELCLRGRAEAASGFASAARGVDTEKLAEYVRGRSATASPEEGERLRALVAGLPEDRSPEGWTRVLERLPDPITPAPTVASIRFAQARARALLVLDRQRESADQAHEAAEAALKAGWWSRAGMLLLHSGHVYGLIGDGKRALAEFGRALEVQTRRENLQEEALLHQQISGLHGVEQRIEEAIVARERAVRLWERTHNREELEADLQLIGMMQVQIGRGDAGRATLARALSIAEESRAEERIAAACAALGLAEREGRRWAAGLALCERALDLHRGLGDKAAMAEDLEGAAQCLGGLARFENARERYEEALALRGELGDRAGAIGVLTSLGLLYTVSDGARAVGYYRQAVEAAERAADDRLVAESLEGLGLAARSAGVDAEAEAAYERAVGIRRRLGDLPVAARLLLQLAKIREECGDFPTAIARCDESLALSGEPGFLEGAMRTGADPRAAARAEALLQRAVVCRSMGERRKAVADVEQALVLCERMGDVREQACCHRDLGRILVELADYAEASRRFERALALATQANERVFANDARQGLGRIHKARGEYPEALREFQAVLEDREKHRDSLGASSCLTDIGHIHREHGEYDLAIGCFTRSLEIARASRRRADEASSLANIAVVHEARGEYDLALAASDEVLAVRHGLADEKGLADALNNRATILGGRGEFAEAVRLHEEAFAIRERLGLRQDVAASLSNLAIAFNRWGEYERALDCYGRAFAIEEGLQTRPSMARILQNIGIVHANRSDHALAVDHLERALALWRALDSPHGVAGCLTALACERKELGDLRGAMDLFAEARELYERLGEVDGVAAVENSLGGMLFKVGDTAGARSAFERSLALSRRIGAHPEIVRTLINLGQLLVSLGEYRKALAMFEEGLEMQRTYRDRRGVANVLNSIGYAYLAMGEFPQALQYIEECLALRTELNIRSEIADSEYNLGVVYKELGDFERARRNFGRALEVSRLQRERPRIAQCLNGLGTVMDDERRWPEARAFYEESLAVAEACGIRPSVAIACNNLGIVCKQQAKWDEGEAYLLRALEIDRASRDRAGIAHTLGNLAELQRMRGDLGAAEECVREALAIGEETQAQGIVFRSHWEMCAVRLDQGRPAEALEAARRALGPFRAVSSGLADEESVKAREKWSPYFEAASRAAIEVGDAEALCEFLETERAGALLDVLGGRARLRSVAVPAALRSREEEARGAMQRALARYRDTLRGGDRTAIRADREALDLARLGMEDVIARIQRQSKMAADVLSAGVPRLEELQGCLGPDEALLLFKCVGERVYALVVSQDEARIRDLGEIGAAADDLCGAGMLAGGDEAGAAADRLAAALVRPLRLDDSVKRILVSPQDRLCYVPFALLDRSREIAYVPSGATYRMLRDAAGARGEQVLALGDPELGEGQSFLRGEPLGRLPASAEEARGVGDDVLVGAEASESGLATSLHRRKRWRAIHLACHAQIDAARPQLSALALAPRDGEDGLLTLAEVLRLDVPADLVVLSACETAQGKVYRAEGVMGFTRAFMCAGSPRVIVSLWKVDDEATKVLMVRFYELWNPKGGAAGLPAAAALRRAQEFVASHAKWRHPRYWAAWQLWGVPE